MEMIKLADKLEDQKKQNRAYVEVNPIPSIILRLPTIPSSNAGTKIMTSGKNPADN